MRDLPIDRFLIDSSAVVGDGKNPSLDYSRAVHLTVYWSQCMSHGPICATASLPKRLAEQLRRGFPLASEDICRLSNGLWPLPDQAFAIPGLPSRVDEAEVKDGGLVSWSLSPEVFILRKRHQLKGYIHIGEVAVESGPPVIIRQRTMHIGKEGPMPGVANNMKLISAVCGLYDGGVRLLPMPMIVEDDDDAERFVALIENEERRQPVVAVACGKSEPVEHWLSDVKDYAIKAFTLQHAAAVTVRGVRHLREVLGPHALQEGSIKTYYPGFTTLDVQHQHRMTASETVAAHPQGREGMLNRWRNRLMTDDAMDRRNDGAP